MSDLDPVVTALLAKLPATGAPWPTFHRRQWLRAMETVFDVVYLENGPIPTIQVEIAPDEPAPKVEIVEPAAPVASAVVAASVVAPAAASSKEQVKPRPGPPRPSGIPSTFEMMQTVLTETPGLVARALVDEIGKRWWPGVEYSRISPEISTAVTSGRFNRDDDGRLTVSAFGLKVETLQPKQRTASNLPVTRPSVQVKTVELPAKQAGFREYSFTHGDKTVMLTKPELELTTALVRAMGKGFLDYQFLGLRGRGATEARRHLPDKQWLSSIMPVLSTKLEPTGLTIAHTDGFGYVMREGQ
jgi:hypothetical protein